MDEEKKEPDGRPESRTRGKTSKTPRRSREQRTRQIKQDVSTCTADDDVPEEPFDHRPTVIQYVEEQRRRDMALSPPQQQNMAYPILLSFLRGLTDRQWRNVRHRIRDGTTRARLAHESERIVKVVAQSIFHILFPAMLVMLEVDALRSADSSSSSPAIRPPVDNPLQKYFNLTEESLAQTIKTVSSPIARSLLGEVVNQLNQGLSVLVACTPSELSVLTTDPSFSVQQSMKQATEGIADILQRHSVAGSSMLGNVVERKSVVQEAMLNCEHFMKSMVESLDCSKGRGGRGGAGAMAVMRKLSDRCNVFSGYREDLSRFVGPETEKIQKEDARSRFSMGTFVARVTTQRQSVLNSPGFCSKTSVTVGSVLRTLMCCACSSSISSSSSFSSSTISLSTSSSHGCPFRTSEGTPPSVPPSVETAATGLIRGFVKEVQGGARSVQEEEEQGGRPLSEEAVRARVQSDANLVFLTMKEKVTEFFRPRLDLTSEADPDEDFLSESPSRDFFPSPSCHSFPDSVSILEDQDMEQVTGRVLKNIVDSCQTILTRLEVAGTGPSHEPAPKLMPYMSRLFSRLNGLTATTAGVSAPSPDAPKREAAAEPRSATCRTPESAPAATPRGVADLKKLSDRRFQANAAARVSEVLLGRDGNAVPVETEAHLDAEAYRLVEGFVAQVVKQACETASAMEAKDKARGDQGKTGSPPGVSDIQDGPSSSLQKPNRREMIRKASLKVCQGMQSRLAFLLSNRRPHQQDGSSEEEEEEDEAEDEGEEQPEWSGSVDTNSSVGSVSSGSRGGDGRTGGTGGTGGGSGSTDGVSGRSGGSGGGSPSSGSVSQDSMPHLELGTELMVSQILCSIKKELGISPSRVKGAAGLREPDRSVEEACVSNIVKQQVDVSVSSGLPALSNVSTKDDSQTIWPPPPPPPPPSLTSTKGPDLLSSSLATVTSMEFHTQATKAVHQALLRSLEEVTRLPPASSCSSGAKQSKSHYTLRPMDVEQLASEVVQSFVSALESADLSAVPSPPGRSRTVAQSLKLLQTIQNQLNSFYQQVLVPAPPGLETGAVERNVSVSETALIRDTQQGGAYVALGNASSTPVPSGANAVDDVTLPVAQSSGPMVCQNFLDRQTNQVVQKLVTSHKAVMSSRGKDSNDRTPPPDPPESDSVAGVLSWIDTFSSRTLPERAWSPVNAADQTKPASSTVSPGVPAKVECVVSGVDDKAVPRHRSSAAALCDRSVAQQHASTVDRVRGLIVKCMERFSFPDPSSAASGSNIVPVSSSSSSSLLESASSEMLDTVVSAERRRVVNEGSESSDSLEITDSTPLEHSSSLDSIGSEGVTGPSAPASYRRLQEKLREVQKSLCQDRSPLPGVGGTKKAEPLLVNQIKATEVDGLLSSPRKSSSASSSRASTNKCCSKGPKSSPPRSTKLPRETPVKSQPEGRRAKICWPQTNRKRGGSTRRSTDDNVGQIRSQSVLLPDVDPARAALGRLKEMVKQDTLRPLVTQLLEQLQAMLEDSQLALFEPGPVRKSHSDPVLSERHRLRREVHSGSSAEYELLSSFVEEMIERLLLPVLPPPAPPPPLPSSFSSERRGAPGGHRGVPGRASTAGACPATPVVQSQCYDKVVNVYSQVIVEQVLGSLTRLPGNRADPADQSQDDGSGVGGSRIRDADSPNAGSSPRGRSVSASAVEDEDNQDEGAGAGKTHGRGSFSEVKESIIDALQRLRRVWKRRNAVSSGTFLTNQTGLREVVRRECFNTSESIHC